MVDCITICNSACIACIWCILFSVCFPRYSKNLKRVDSSECCVYKKSVQKRRKAQSHDFPRYVKADLVHARRRFKDLSHFERDYEDRRGHRSYHREKMHDKESEKHRNACRCLENHRTTSSVCSRRVKRSNDYNKSDNSSSKKNDNTVSKINESDNHICKRS